MVISDNGASAEGGPTGTTNEAQFFNNAQEPFEDSVAVIDEIGGPKHFNHYPWGWTFAGNTPFGVGSARLIAAGRLTRSSSAGRRASRPAGEVREQYAHAIDMVPTVLDVLGIEPPATIRGVTQSPLHGVSLAHTFDDAGAPSRRTTQYFEMMGHRSIYHDGWRAVCPGRGRRSRRRARGSASRSPRRRWPHLDAEGWELYHVAEDPAECHDVAAGERDRLIALIATWYVEAGRYDVMPVDGSGLARHGEREAADRRAARPVRLLPGHAVGAVLRRGAGAQPPAQHHRRGRHPRAGGRGRPARARDSRGRLHVLRQGRASALHPQLGRARAAARRLGREVSSGSHALRFELEPTGQPDPASGHGVPARLQVYLDGELAGDREVPYTTPFAFNPGALTCGADPGSPVTTDYEGPFRFTGTIHTVTVDLGGELIIDAEAELKLHMARQ